MCDSAFPSISVLVNVADTSPMVVMAWELEDDSSGGDHEWCKQGLGHFQSGLGISGFRQH